MPRKRPIARDAQYIQKVVSDGYSALLLVRSILAGYFKQDHRVMRKIERLVEGYCDLQKDSEHEIDQESGK